MKNRISRRNFLKCMAATGAAVGLSACGAATSATASTASSLANASSAASSGTANSASAAGDITSWILEKDTSMSGKVRFWMPFKGDAGMDAMLADFNKTYPNIQVELTTYNNNSDGNLSVNTSIMSGEVDVLGSFGLSSTWKRWDNAMFEDLTDKFEAEGIDLVANWGTDVFKYNDCIYTLPCGGMSYYISVNMTAWNA